MSNTSGMGVWQWNGSRVGVLCCAHDNCHVEGGAASNWTPKEETRTENGHEEEEEVIDPEAQKKPVGTMFKIISMGAFLTFFVLNFVIGLGSLDTPELIGHTMAPVIFCGLFIGVLFIFKSLRTERVVYTTMLVSASLFFLGSAGNLARYVATIKPLPKEPASTVTKPR